MKTIIVYATIAVICATFTICNSIPIDTVSRFSISVCILVLTVLIQQWIRINTLSSRLEYKKNFIETFIKNCPDIVDIKDENFKYLVCNNAFCTAFGIAQPKDVEGRDDFSIMNNEAAQIIRNHDEMVVRYGAVEKYNVKIKLNDTGYKIYEIISAPMRQKEEIVGIVTISRDMTIRENLRKQYIENLYQMNAILENLPVIAYLKDRNGNYIRGNDKLAKLFNCPESEIIGRPTKDLYREHGIDSVEEIDEKIFQGKKGTNFDIKIKISEGNDEWFRVYKAPIFDSSDEVSGITVFLTNITPEKDLEKQRETFIATLSHDLKTPTIAQIRSLELLLREDFGSLNEEQRDMLNLTLDSCRYMYEMVTTVLSTYKYESGEVNLNLKDTNIQELTQECCNEIKHLLKEKNLTIRTNTENLSNNILIVDKVQIKRVITNFLSNALSYAYDNSEIVITMENDRKNNFIFKLKSKSPYIEPELMKTLFKKYTTHASKFNKVGDGLGLYLAKQIVTLHGGKVLAESCKNEENIFGFILKATSNAQLIVKEN